jgi:predicted adenylyl cyclase CyaB
MVQQKRMNISEIMKNIELKVKVGDRVAMARLIRKLGAEKNGILRQTDTYFDAPNGRLKLREEKSRDDADLIFYSRPDKKTSRLSEYDILKIAGADVKRMKRFLEKSLSIKVIVKKERTLFIHKNTRIHLDRVFGLGDYLELETVMTKQSLVEAKKEHAAVIEALSLDSCEKIPVSYSDLLMPDRKDSL